MNYYGDYIGFQFGEYHSRDLGLIRVIDSRYDDFMTPIFTDLTQVIPGGDGTYYWDSFYTQRSFTIKVAFDSITELQLRQIRYIFNGKAEDFLIFDEVPYKKYRVKLKEVPQFTYIPFEIEGARIYKGEGTLNFISYTPYAIDNFKYLSTAEKTLYPTWDEWAETVKLLSDNSLIGTKADNRNTYYVYNPGDIETPCKLNIEGISSTPQDITIKLYDSNESNIYGQLILKDVVAKGNDTSICIDMAKNLIYGNSNQLYNQYIVAGDFFKIPRDASAPAESSQCNRIIVSGITNPFTVGDTNCEYNYLFY